MKTSVQKWGNSLAVRIPQAFAQEMGLDRNSPVELSVQEGRLVIQLTYEYELDDLLEDVTPANLHSEIDTGPAQGNEAW